MNGVTTTIARSVTSVETLPTVMISAIAMAPIKTYSKLIAVFILVVSDSDAAGT